jgi:transcription-repair coupling factor (superfamily II helicase)
VLRLQRLYPGSVVKDVAGSVLLPRPTRAADAGESLKDTDLLRWATEVISQIFEGS